MEKTWNARGSDDLPVAVRMRMVDEDADFCALQFAADLYVRKFGEFPEGGEFFFACHGVGGVERLCAPQVRPDVSRLWLRGADINRKLRHGF